MSIYRTLMKNKMKVAFKATLSRLSKVRICHVWFIFLRCLAIIITRKLKQSSDQHTFIDHNLRP